MITVKKNIYICIAAGLLFAALSACNKNKNAEAQAPPPIEFKPPVVQPLGLSKPKNINWAAIKTVPIVPVVEKFELNKLPVRSYDSSGFKPFPKNDSVTSFNYNPNPEQDFKIDKLPSKPLVFKSYILAPPKHIRVGPPKLRAAGTAPIYELPDVFQGTSVTCLFTDHEGFLWIGGKQGLFRYDGEDLCSYITGPLDYNIINMAEDKLGRIWVCSFNQVLQIVDPRGGTLRKLTMAQGLSSNNPFRMLIDKQQRIWIAGGLSGGVSIIDQQAETIRFLNKKNGLADTVAMGITQDKLNRIWISGGKSLSVVDLENKTIKHIDKANCAKLDTTFSTALFCDRAGNIWMGMNNGAVNVLNPQTNSMQLFEEAKASNPNVLNFSQDDKGRVWISNQNVGAEIINLPNHTLQNLKRESGLNSDVVINATQDNRGQEWIATFMGLNMIPHSGVVKEQIGKVPTGTLFEDGRGLIWQASISSDLDILDRKNKTIRHLTTREGLTNDSIQNIRQIDGKIFICTNAGLDIIDSVKQTISHLSIKQGLHSRNIFAVAQDNAGRIWIGGGRNGLDVYDPKDNTLKFIDKGAGLANALFTDLMKDKQGNIWMSSAVGAIGYIDPAKGIIRYITNTSDLNLPPSRIFAQDEWGNIWIGTHHGIYIADFRHQTLSTFSAAQGLADETVLSLLRYKHDMYAGTSKGITKIIPPADGIKADGQWGVQSFGINYGLGKVTTSYLSDLITRDGLYWWGDVGATVLDLGHKDTTQSIPYISGIRIMDSQKAFVDRSLFNVSGTDTLWGQGNTHYVKGEIPINSGYALDEGIKWDSVDGPYNLPSNLQLPHNQNYVQFEFSALNLAKRDTSWYRYRLTGLDDEWSEPTPIPFSRNYFNLRRGLYTFEVSVKSKDGTWSKPAELDFTINPPWWVSLWACIIYVFLMAGIVYGFVYYRSLQLLREKRVLEHKINLRTEEVLQQKEELEAQRDELEKAFGELKVTQTQLVQSEKLASLGELTAGIAHEIQNPLNFVNNFAEVSVELIAELKEEQAKEVRDPELENEILESLEQNLQKITLHGKRADGIVKNMLQHSRNNSGERELTDINNLADEYFRLSYHGLRAKDKTFNSAMENYLDDSAPKINLVPQDIGRVLLNLFNNAFYAVHQKKKTITGRYQPTVTLTTTVKKGFVEISVRDNGNGIPDSIKDKIMQPFFTTKPTGEGTGLGLSLSYDIIVKGHAGSINIDTKEGEYTEFTISLPAQN